VSVSFAVEEKAIGLSITLEEAPRLGEHLSWFFEVLYFMGKDLREPEVMMARHFVFAR